jgi:hypothetical protein
MERNFSIQTDHIFGMDSSFKLNVDHGTRVRLPHSTTAATADRGKRAPLLDISPQNHKRTNGYIAGFAKASSITPWDEVVETPIFPEGLYRREYLAGHKAKKLVYSSIDWKWRSPQGKIMDKGLFYAVHDELQRPKTGTKKKQCGPNWELFSTLLGSLMGFVYSSRYLKTREEALIMCVFNVMADQYPKINYSRRYC